MLKIRQLHSFSHKNKLLIARNPPEVKEGDPLRLGKGTRLGEGIAPEVSEVEPLSVRLSRVQ